jgi:beta-galactosidase
VTLPLHAHLGTEGVYAWTKSLAKDKADIGVTSEIANAGDTTTNATITHSLVDSDDKIVASTSQDISIPPSGKLKLSASLQVADPHLWEPSYPYVYQIRVTVASGGTARDVASSPFGIRNFRFDRDTGFWINGRHVKLHGWGQKPGQEWAGLGTGIPDWMHDHTLQLMKEAGGNMLRWGHCAGPPVGADCADKYGFVTLMPGVDGERDCTGKAWSTRTAAFRDLIIYYRNHPSIFVWEGGNYNVSPEHAAEMRAIKEKWDPHGRRYFGFRMSTPGMLESLDIELGTVGRTRALPTLPVVETEYDRTETPRRVWDRFSPPDFGKLGKNAEQNTYNFDSEGFATNAISEWWTLFGSKPEHSGGANWIFSDGTHGTRQVTDVARATGEVDAVRLPKEAYWALQATWEETPRVHLIGHWNYAEGTVKDMFAVAKADEVELCINGKSHGMGTRSLDTLFTWKNITFQPGEVKVIARRNGKEIASQTKQTAGEAVALRLTPVTAPGGWHADGSDIALVDFEVVDAQGRRCPIDQAKVDFEISGPAIWRGGYNSGKQGSTNHLHLDTECGINRVSLRSTLTPGEVVLTARRDGLAPATLKLQTLPVALENGILGVPPRVLAARLPRRPEIDGAALAKLTELREHPPQAPVTAADSKSFFSSFAYTGDGAGGMEDPVTDGMLAYSDDAVLTLTGIPERLKNTNIIRTANRDRAYWANDYIVGTARRSFELIVAHDPKLKAPEWLKDFKKTGEKLQVNDRPMILYSKTMKPDESLRISGNVDQGVMAKAGLNFLLFCRPTS